MEIQCPKHKGWFHIKDILDIWRCGLSTRLDACNNLFLLFAFFFSFCLSYNQSLKHLQMLAWQSANYVRPTNFFYVMNL